MDPETRVQLEHLLTTGRFATLGSLLDDAPFVSLVPYVVSPDLTAFYIHISDLAIHTRNILADSRAALMVFEAGEAGQDPQTLARLSIQVNAVEITPEEDRFGDAKSAYIKKNPQAEGNFKIGGFRLFELRLKSARFVGGFGRILDLEPKDLARIARGNS